ncbi:hypothetical protein CGZ88_0860 [Bifidobacterium anseris]|uniref:Uncharacterized protein n=1 Tax=Bifidobacterium anseris TaxID=2020963 RepID=A0A2N5IZF0_9BIFI|nr:hypothetical protein CGZ88_0860 [Bifidobacterium anseris]
MPFNREYVMGSSPRLRGAPRTYRHRQRQVGIIPALAGSTSYRKLPVVSSRDHPRACGEHIDTRIRPKTITGSSPRLRGALGAFEQVVQRRGIIPALAGSTTAAGHQDPAPRDHPRACGEHTKKSLCFQHIIDQREAFSFTFHGALRISSSAVSFSRSLPISSRTSVFRSIAPAASRFAGKCLEGLLLIRLIRMLDQLQTVTVDRLPIRSEHAKIHMLFVARREDHDGSPILQCIHYAFP